MATEPERTDDRKDKMEYEEEFYWSPDCHHCHGTGIMWVMIGDEPEKDMCYCVNKRSEMAKELAKYPSKSSPGKEYTIFEAADGTEYCDCWIWKRKKTCKHLVDYQKSGAPSVVATKPATMKSGEKTVIKPKSEVDHVVDNIINSMV